MAIDGTLIKKARESRGKKQEDLARLINTDQTYISKIEKNKLKGGIKGDELLKIAKYLEYDPYVFLGDITFEEGDLRNKKREDEIIALKDAIEKLQEQVKPIDKLDPVAEKVMINQALHDLVELIQFWDATMIRRFTDIAYGFVSGTRYNEEHKKEKHA